MDDEVIELWKPIPGFEGYAEASNLGRIRTLDRTYTNVSGIRRTFKGHLVPFWLRRDGYWMTSIPGPNGQRKIAVHRAVLLAFVGSCPEGMEACHNDGDRKNARLVNLRWDTRKSNHADKIIHGTAQRGERAGTAKLTEDQVVEILVSREPSNAIAKRFNVSGAAVRSIRTGKSWAHIRSDVDALGAGARPQGREKLQCLEY